MDEVREDVRRVSLRLRLIAGDRLLLRWHDLRRVRLLGEGWSRWVAKVREINSPRMEADAAQWKLHALVNSEKDLQAWYHATFAPELYRLRGAFWYKEAVLPEYDGHPIEKCEAGATPSDILCAPNAIYTAMAAAMYTIRATLSEDEYALFEKLTTDGVVVSKKPYRTPGGRPQKKRFQLSLVQGELYLFMYLTWKGKHGTQGIELASVDRIDRHEQASTYSRLCLVATDRSLDLCFDSIQELSLWHSALDHLVEIEKEVRVKSSPRR